MKGFYDEFMKVIQTEDRESSLKLILSKLESGEIDIVTLYNDVLTPSLNSMVQGDEDKAFIWREHVRSSIVRTILENCYPYVIKERVEKYKASVNKRVAVVCPAEELHEIGARMITDFFTLLGYDSIFVGSNTPREEFFDVLKIIELDYIAMSVSNPYNLVAAKKTIDRIRVANPKIKVFVGGNAFKGRENSFKEVGADRLLQTFEDIKGVEGCD